MEENLLDTQLDVVVAAVQHQFGLLRRLVGAVDARETGDLSSAGLLVETLRVTKFAHFEGRVDVDLDKF